VPTTAARWWRPWGTASPGTQPPSGPSPPAWCWCSATGGRREAISIDGLFFFFWVFIGGWHRAFWFIAANSELDYESATVLIFFFFFYDFARLHSATLLESEKHGLMLCNQYIGKKFQINTWCRNKKTTNQQAQS
jgi:hypothetical protein